MLIAIVADTRVGSTALGNALSCEGECSFHGEILYPEETDRSDHLYSSICSSGIPVLLNRSSLFGLLDNFFNPMINDSSIVHIVDIKYHDFNLIPEHPHSVLSTPVLLRYLVTKNIKIVHLNRRNKLSAALSELMASVTRVHHIMDTRDVSEFSAEGAKIGLDPSEVILNAVSRGRAHDRVREWLRDYEGVLDLEYEALFLDHAGPSRLTQLLADTWGVPNISFVERTTKISDLVQPDASTLDALVQLAEGTTWHRDAIELRAASSTRQS